VIDDCRPYLGAATPFAVAVMEVCDLNSKTLHAWKQTLVMPRRW
jgi:hypothetical protein